MHSEAAAPARHRPHPVDDPGLKEIPLDPDLFRAREKGPKPPEQDIAELAVAFYTQYSRTPTLAEFKTAEERQAASPLLKERADKLKLEMQARQEAAEAAHAFVVEYLVSHPGAAIDEVLAQGCAAHHSPRRLMNALARVHKVQ